MTETIARVFQHLIPKLSKIFFMLMTHSDYHIIMSKLPSELKKIQHAIEPFTLTFHIPNTNFNTLKTPFREKYVDSLQCNTVILSKYVQSLQCTAQKLVIKEKQDIDYFG